VVRLVLPPAREVVAEAPREHLPERELVFLGERLPQTRVVRGRPLGDRSHQRHELAPELGEERAHGRRLHPRVGVVDERIGDVLVRREESRVGPAELHRLFELGTNPGEVVGGPRPRPELVRFGAVVGELAHERARDFRRPLVIAPRHADERRHLRARRFVAFLERGVDAIEQAPHLGIGDAIVRESIERGELPTTRRRAAGRHVGRLIPPQDRRGRLEVVVLLQPRFQGVESVVHASLR
jgi:hypothetical protein